MKTISSLFASAAHVIKDRLFKEADHHEYGDDIVVIYKRRIKYYINLSAYCREKLLLELWGASFRVFQVDNERWVATEGKEVISGESAQFSQKSAFLKLMQQRSHVPLELRQKQLEESTATRNHTAGTDRLARRRARGKEVLEPHRRGMGTRGRRGSDPAARPAPGHRRPDSSPQTEGGRSGLNGAGFAPAPFTFPCRLQYRFP